MGFSFKGLRKSAISKHYQFTYHHTLNTKYKIFNHGFNYKTFRALPRNDANQSSLSIKLKKLHNTLERYKLHSDVLPLFRRGFFDILFWHFDSLLSVLKVHKKNINNCDTNCNTKLLYRSKT